ncbi:amino acid adenylation domain-containing protein [Motilimonas sp. 1_MG-2023]|uniref:non-ribosomal peptide synthetase n=1 Tax=Motilimonas sp. 1_MG-2023 TaxID=3062672 RepID=UPI0026E19641|nr:non-ribosomal peptide synthetase [Motilimonas sp. 1_MG-2023]MDO6526357.1 amino acid adenylation domain-containing protein [Motilimonas sp. 1_MG-2023]
MRNTDVSYSAQSPLAKRISGLVQPQFDKETAFTLLQLEILWVQLQSVGFDLTEQDWVISEIIDSKFHLWLDEAARYLRVAGYPKTTDASTALWDRWKAFKDSRSDLLPQIELVESTLAVLPDILRGRIPVTDILFPNESMEKVEGMYKNNPQADYFNNVVAQAVATILEARKAANNFQKLRILEVGAGTGGTSQAVFAALKSYAEQVGIYTYSDISKAFLLHANSRFKKENPCLDCKLLNIEEDLESQSFAIGSYDIVIATNVLHATKDIRKTLRNVKSAMKRNGVVLINEMVASSLFSHLTFGLTDGWWLANDTESRLQGCPFLSVSQWKAALADEGFDRIRIPVDIEGECDQQVVIAHSDGIIQRALQKRPDTVLSKPLNNPRTRPVVAESPAPQRQQARRAESHSTDTLKDKTTFLIKERVSAALNMPVSEIDDERPLADYGVDSIMVVQLTNSLKEVLLNVTNPVFFEHPSIAALTGHFVATQAEHLRNYFGEQASTENSNIEHAAAENSGKKIKTPVSGRNKNLVQKPVKAEPRQSISPANVTAVLPESSVAIVGMAGRYPQAPTLESYWENLIAGNNCIGEIPKERWDWRAYYSEEKEWGKSYTRWGGFIEDADKFDPLFFHISPNEAERMDPQERVFLETAYGAIEDAGYCPSTLADTYKVGVYVGVMNSTYNELTSYWSVANRVSYSLNFRGPSLAVDSACSSSLTAIHLALGSLKRGECDCVIVGGVNLIARPTHHMGLSSMSMLTAGAQCKAFGADADGFVSGEGVGALMLKPLESARQSNDHIYGVIKGSAINAGGKTQGYSVPNPGAQGEVIVEALKEAQVDPKALSYVEAHGTGTALGDPIEIAGLSKAFERAGSADTLAQPCAIGSVKSNIGHLESAAGVAAVTKVLLQMKHRQLVPSLHADTLNPGIDFDNTPFQVQRTLAPWPQPTRTIDGREQVLPRIAGVSSFGAGGANAHVIIEEYVEETPQAEASAPESVVIVLSARQETQLFDQAKHLLRYLEAQSGDSLALGDIAYTLQVGREAMEERMGTTVDSLSALVARLRQYVEDPNAVEGWRRGSTNNKQALSILKGDEELQETMAKWLERGKADKLLSFWVQGMSVDWEKLYGDAHPRRVSLPTYPFARERYWLERASLTPETKSRLHPLVHDNTSTVFDTDFSATFTGSEFFLRDHRLQGVKTLPGAAHLEMAREAIARAFGLDESEAMAVQLSDVVWLRPAVMTDEALALHIRVLPESEQALEYEIYSLDDSGEETVYSQGKARLNAVEALPALELSAWGGMNSKTLAPEKIYEAFEDAGLEYGSGHRGITGLRVAITEGGVPEVLAELQLSAELTGTHEAYGLHPALLDSALQASLGLAMADDAKASEELLLPFSLGTLQMQGRIPAVAYARVAYSAGSKPGDAVQKLDVTVCDDQGNVCVALKGFSSRNFSRGSAEQRVTCLSPVWEAAELAKGAKEVAAGEHYVLLAGAVSAGEQGALVRALPKSVHCDVLGVVNPTSHTQDTHYRESALQLFNAVRARLEARPTGPVLVQLVIQQTDDETSHYLEGLSGLLKSASQETPMLQTQCLQVADRVDAETLAAWIQQNAANSQTQEVRYVDGERQIRVWREADEAAAQTPAPWRDGGVYLITGGAGGLGLIFAEAIAAHTTGATVVLVGRRPSLDDDVAQRLAALGTVNVDYQSVDIGDAGAVRGLIAHIEQGYGTLTGIIHSAGVLEDNFVLKKTAAELDRVFAPKVSGAVNLDRASQHLALEYFVCFGSLAGVLGNAGQTDYAAANGFLDAFAACRNRRVGRGERQGKTLAIDWPLWSDGGMQVTPSVLENLRQLGLAPLGREAGINAFKACIESTAEQVLVSAGEKEAIVRLLLMQAGLAEPETEAEEQQGELIASELKGGDLQEKALAYFKAQLSSALKLPLSRLDEDASMELYGMDSVMAMQLTSHLEKAFGPLAKTLFFEVQTVRALSEYFIEQYPERLHQVLGAGAAVVKAKAKTTENTRGLPVAQEPTARPGRALRRRPAPVSGLGRESMEPGAVAIIGINGRYPQAGDLTEFWDNLRAGKDCVTEIPAERWDHSVYFDPDKNRQGTSYSKWGGFIDGVDQFDPLFFNISPREAKNMHPQQRLFLEGVSVLLEDNGLTRERIKQKYQHRVGVYVGATHQMYQTEDSDLPGLAATSTSYNAMANRISHFFDLEGPSMVVDSMCSSSALAIHLACQDIQRGECLLAIAGGVNLILHPSKYLTLGLVQMLGSDANSRSFNDGDGFIPTEGVGAVLLKPLESAIEDGDDIRAVIRGSATLHSGRTNYFMAPAVNAQAKVIEQCIERAKVSKASISYVEVAANGSALGDAIEVSALEKVFKGDQHAKGTVALGSVKSNLGHPEAASGIAQLTKVVMQLQQRQLTPLVKTDQLNPNLNFENSPFVLCRELKEWQSDDNPRRALINTVGAGGTYVSMVVEEPPVQEKPWPSAPAHPQIIPLSASNVERLNEVIKRLLAHLKRYPEISFSDLAYTLQLGREPMPARLALVASSVAGLIEGLEKGNQGDVPCYSGNVEDDNSSLLDLLSGPSGESFIHMLISDGDLAKLAAFWVQGGKVPWSSLHEQHKGRIIPLPTYPFEHKSYWLEMDNTQLTKRFCQDSESEQGITTSANVEVESNDFEDYLKTFFGDVLDIAPEQIVVNRELQNYGVDSIIGLRLMRQLEKDFDVIVLHREMLDHTTVASLAQFLQGKAAENSESENLTEQPSTGSEDPLFVHARHPLSEGQKGLWMLSKADPSSSAYNLPLCFRISEHIDIERFQKACDYVVKVHPLLGAQVTEDSGTPMMEYSANPSSSFEYHDVSNLSKEEYLPLLKEAAKAPFDLSGDALVRFKLYLTAPGEVVVMIVVHHIVFDGASTPIFLCTLFSAYETLVNGGDLNSITPSNPFADFVHWEKDMLANQQGQKYQNYWKEQLGGDLPVLELDIEHTSIAETAMTGESYAFSMPSSLGSKVNDFCLNNKAQPAIFFLAVYKMLLQRYSGERDIIVGMPAMGRPGLAFDEAVGYFVNMLPIRSHIEDDTSFADYLAELKLIMADGLDHGAYPFPQMVKDLDTLNGIDASPVFQVAFTFQNRNMLQLSRSEQEGNRAQSRSLDMMEDIIQEGEYKLSLEIFEDSDGFVCYLKYDPERFERDDIALLMEHYTMLTEAVISDGGLNLGAYDMMSAQERKRVMVEWAGVVKPYAKDVCFHELFESQVEKTPNHTALICEGRQMTYAELNARANRLAHYLNQQGVKPDTLVGLCTERSLDMVIGMLGILKAGGAFLPIDLEYPSERIEYMLADSDVSIVLAHSHLKEQFYGEQRICVYLDSESDSNGGVDVLSRQSGQNLPKEAVSLNANHLAYVIYTSGSTGKPKGVMIEHLGFCNAVQDNSEEFQLQSESVFMQNASIAFDIGPWVIGMSLIRGAAVCVVKDRNSFADTLESVINENAVTHIMMTPSVLQTINPEAVLGLQCVISGGELCTLELANKWYEQVTFYNGYGPTENSICATLHRHTSPTKIPIGKPNANTHIYVLGDDMRVQPIGVAGEIYIGGVQLARGYLNRPDLTAEKFVRDPYGANLGDLIYKTGDIGRWLPDGSLEYLARSDNQVKLRGFRIELGEIESRLTEHAAVDACVVVVRELSLGDMQLVAYVVAESQKDCDGSSQQSAEFFGELVAHLQQSLPAYMVPVFYTMLDELPLTGNGKVDYRALPAPDESSYAILANGTYVAPATEMEQMLVSVWTELLPFGEDEISVAANFFSLGGHSLLVVTMISRLRELGFHLSVKNIFREPTIEALAKIITVSCEETSNAVPENGIPSGCEQVTPEMVTLVDLTETELESIASKFGGHKNIQDIYPLGPLQEGVWFHHLLDVDNDPYVLTSVFSVDNESHLNAFLDGLRWVIQRHDVLRTAVVTTETSKAIQVVNRQVELPVDPLLLDSNLDVNEQLETLCTETQSMALDRAPLLRVRVGQNPESKAWIMVFNLHHIIFDHIGWEIILQEVSAYLAGKSEELTTPVPYRNFVGLALQQSQQSNAEAFFRKYLADVTEPTAPFDLLDVRGDGADIEELRKPLSSTLARTIRSTARQMNLNPATLFHAAWALVVASCSGRQDVVFGTVLSGRLQGAEGAERTLGLFINTLPMRIMLEGKSIRQLVAETDSSLLDLIVHEQAPLTLAQNCSGLSGDLALFSAVINFRHSQPTENNDEQNELGVHLVDVYERSNYPFSVSVDDFGEGFLLTAQVDKSVSSERLIGYLETALEGIVETIGREPDTPVSELSILPDVERQKLLLEWNDTSEPYLEDKCLHELFEAQVAKRPDQIAVRFEQQAITYSELNARANQVAHYLVSQGVKPDSLVGLCVERSLEMVIGLLGIIKAGGAYVPIDSAYPADRIEYMLKDSKVSLILSQTSLGHLFSNNEIDAIYLDADTDSLGNSQLVSNQSVDNIAKQTIGLTSGNLSYVIYTSGSTGRPKGVKIEHKGWVNLSLAQAKIFQIDPDSLGLQFASFSFDAAASEIGIVLTQGAALLLITKAQQQDVRQLCECIEVNKVTHATLPPVLLEQLDREKLRSISVLTVAGEQIASQTAKEWMSGRCLINAYGPTETTVCATAGQLHSHDERVHIGKPINNARCYILNDERSLVPVGVTGELYVGGAGVARGYLNNRPLTTERFIQSPFSEDNSDRLYRTGDLARWLPDGNIEFMGRADDQIKIRGVRVELGEIEEQLLQHPDLSACVVMVQKGKSDNKVLVAYVVSRDEYGPWQGTGYQQILRDHLQYRLPENMVPSVYIQLETLPLTNNGKVDKKALPVPDEGSLQKEEYVAPRNDIEEVLCQLVQEVLSIDRVGIHDNFFILGGHSLLATGFVGQVKQRLGKELSLRAVFDGPTVAEMASALLRDLPETGSHDLVPVDRQAEILPLSHQQQDLWFLNAHLGRSYDNVQVVFRLTGELDSGILIKSFKVILERHEILRTRFVESGEGLQQVVHPLGDFALTEEALSGEVNLQELCQTEKDKRFDQLDELMIRIRLLKLSDDERVLILTRPWGIFDGWSLGVFFTELRTLYQVFRMGLPAQLPPLEVQYADFAHWQCKTIDDEALNVQLSYWEKQLAGLPPLLHLATDNERPPVKSYEGSQVTVSISPDILDALSTFSQQQGVTLYMTLLSAYFVLLSRYSDQKDIPIGSPVSNRPKAELEPLIGYFVNIIVLRANIGDDPQFIDLLSEVKHTTLDALAHKDVPYRSVVDKLCPQRSLAFNPLCQVTFNLLNMPLPDSFDSSLSAAPVEFDNKVAKFDLDLVLREMPNGLMGYMEYSKDLFRKETIEQMVEDFGVLLQQILAHPDKKLSQLGLGVTEQPGEVVLN